MDVWQAIENRRTVHDYQPDVEIGQEMLNEALQLALTAPNHKFTFPWKFIQVGPQTREKLAVLAKDFAKDKGAPEPMQEKSHDKVLAPSALIVFCYQTSDTEYQMQEDYASVACAIQNFTLSLAGHGFMSKWSSGRLTSDAKTYDILGLDIQQIRIAGFVWVGHPTTEPPKRRRPTLDQCLIELP